MHSFLSKHLLPHGFSPDSKVWIYQSNRPFTEAETGQIENLFNDFIVRWNSHGTPVKGFAALFFEQFIILMADETATGVSGCSTDSSVRLIKEIEKLFNVELFDRLSLAFVVNNEVRLVPLTQLTKAIDDNLLTKETLYFNNLVATKEALENKWLRPMSESWLASR